MVRDENEMENEKRRGGSKMDDDDDDNYDKDDRMKLANNLIGDYCTPKRPGRVSSSLRLLPLLHFPRKSTSRKRGQCTLCCQSEKCTDTT